MRGYGKPIIPELDACKEREIEERGRRLMRYIYAAVVVIIAFVAIAVGAAVAYAEGVQVSGQRQVCPLGSEWVQISVGARTLFGECMSTAELERAGYKSIAGTDAGSVVCRTLIVRSGA